MPRKLRNATPRRRRKSGQTGQLELPLPAPQERQSLALALDRLAKEDDDALLAAAVRRLREGKPSTPQPAFLARGWADSTPETIMAEVMVKVGRDWNDPEMEAHGLRMLRRLH
jgi:hypothetical protein